MRMNKQWLPVQCIGILKTCWATGPSAKWEVAIRNCFSEGAFLRKGVSRKSRALRTFGNFHPHRRRFRGRNSCRTQHGVLSEDFVVNLGDEVILAVRFAAPHLSELDGIDCHDD